MDAGVIELGLEYTDKMAIPPGQERFPLSGYCVSECTAVVRNFFSNRTVEDRSGIIFTDPSFNGRRWSGL